MASRGSLFDLRWIIAVLFGVYGVVLLVMGIGFETDADRAKTGGFNVNLWVGIGMLVFTALMAGWALLRPLRIPDEAK
jgi:drug/metabolite transporter (DMT)-like permease